MQKRPSSSAPSASAPQAAEPPDPQVHPLVAQLREGDTQAFDTLVRTWATSLYRFAYTLTRDAALAEDVVQDVFVYLWDHRERFDVTHNLKAYLFQAVRNRALNTLQHEQAQHRAEAVAHSHGDPTATNAGDLAIDQADLARYIREALATLPPRAREIFLLHREQGMSYPEIATVLGIGIPTIHNQISRAAKVVRDAIERWRGGG